ncbi:phage holin family protein [Actinocorallia sp. A-T 12471]|uniref:phage holin family protein n=1 Tax=Actinocorallia sp. A-T 12471 TaxID=3089813 RepID=UPI0029D177DA|nr:phage holin family protein [Actinocorallia sp. A-T 12471]MDX6739245.1 phage holin family protein [Actinocorallia sp. A-T 12471]
MNFLIRFVINAVALLVATWIVSGVDLTGHDTASQAWTLAAVALIFGLLNAFLKPVIKVLGCAFYVLTLGLFALVVNACLVMLTGWIADKFHLPFHVSGFWPAFWAAIIISLVSWLLSLFVDADDRR